MEGNSNLAKKQYQLINQSAESGHVFIAAISLLEISMLIMKKRISINKSVLIWIQDALALPGIFLKPLTPEIAHDQEIINYSKKNRLL